MNPDWVAAAEEDDVRVRGDDGVGGELEEILQCRAVAQPPAGQGDRLRSGVVEFDEIILIPVALAVSIGVASKAGRRVGEHFADEEGVGQGLGMMWVWPGEKRALTVEAVLCGTHAPPSGGWRTRDCLLGQGVCETTVDLMAIVVDQANHLALAGQSIADFSVVGIDGDGESRRVAAAEEDDVRAGFDDGVGGELEVFLRSRAVAQLPVGQGDGF